MVLLEPCGVVVRHVGDRQACFAGRYHTPQLTSLQTWFGQATSIVNLPVSGFCGIWDALPWESCGRGIGFIFGGLVSRARMYDLCRILYCLTPPSLLGSLSIVLVYVLSGV